MTNSKIKNFTDLITWQEAHALVLEVYQITKRFPKEELFCLVTQMRRSSVSITSNIAEGFGRLSAKEKIRYYSIAHGSLTELQNQLMISKDIGYLNQEKFQELFLKTVLVHKLITGLIKSVSSQPLLPPT
jgi:four helix bundle protein